MLTYDLNRSDKESLYFQLYHFIRSDIEAGDLKVGQRLPSKRELSAHLGISIITVEAALAQLIAEGYVEAKPRRGFFVCHIEKAGTRDERREDERNDGRCDANSATNEPDGSENPKNSAPDSKIVADLSGKTPPTGIFPYAAWARTMRSVLSSENEQTLLTAGDARGSLALRRAIAKHLRGFRGMDVHPDQVVIGSGAQSLYALVIQLLGRDLVYAVEDPGYTRLARIYDSNDVKLASIGMDAAGPLPADLSRCGVDVFHCMPSHQFPTGITVPIARRHELLSWANNASEARRRYIIEDDFDCEFRMTGRPIPSLQLLDESGCVIYTNTFTKTLGAAFRIGYMVLPPKLARKFCDELGFYTCTVGALEQLTLARFIESGEYERHVNRQRTHFRKVLEALVHELERLDNGSCLRFKNVGSGLHFIMEVHIDDECEEHAGDAESTIKVEGRKSLSVDASIIEEAITQEALANGVELSPINRYRIAGCEVLVGDTVGDVAGSAETDAVPQVGGADTDAGNGISTSIRRHPQFVMNFASINEASAPDVARRIIRAIDKVIQSI